MMMKFVMVDVFHGKIIIRKQIMVFVNVLVSRIDFAFFMVKFLKTHRKTTIVFILEYGDRIGSVCVWDDFFGIDSMPMSSPRCSTFRQCQDCTDEAKHPDRVCVFCGSTCREASAVIPATCNDMIADEPTECEEYVVWCIL
jgi:hypothetical protein